MKIRVCVWNRDCDFYIGFLHKYGKKSVIAIKSNEEIDSDYIKEDDTQGDMYVRAFHIKAVDIIETDSEFTDNRFRFIYSTYDLSNGKPIFRYERIGYWW